MNVLITGSNGLIGSEAVRHFDAKGHRVVGVDNNLRREFFGPEGDTSWNLSRLVQETHAFEPLALDIRDRDSVAALYARERFDLVIHCAAQPSHDKARDIPLVDFDVNAVGTLNLLEATRIHAPGAVFIHMSTNKVYGDAPNEYPLVETETRYDYARPEHHEGIDENCRIDQCLHSLFGASKTAADVMAQEYGRYFGLKVGIFRGGCLTGPAHSAVSLHGFLAYLTRVAVDGETYTVLGYKGKQVRDQLHSSDVIRAFELFANAPRPGEVYNLGGGRANSASVLECIALIEEITGEPVSWRYSPENRTGDHICYISDMRKFRAHYPDWSISRSLRRICEELVAACQHARGSRQRRLHSSQ
jgi:CDP-paratose 2-epimerase